MGLKKLIEWATSWQIQRLRNIEDFKKLKPHLDKIAEAGNKKIMERDENQSE